MALLKLSNHPVFKMDTNNLCPSTIERFEL